MGELSQQWLRIRLTFADGEARDVSINAEKGDFHFRVVPECPAVTSISVLAPEAAVDIDD